MVLAIISHTEHYIDSSGRLLGWGATIREINNLANVFDRIIHIAPLHEGKAPDGMLPYESDKIEFTPLKPSGGQSVADKLGIVWKFPSNLAVIKRALDICDIFQFRGPTGIGVFLIPYLLWLRKKGWFKYAGNWVQENPPLGYRIQRYLLSSQNKRIVTINGRWSGQKNNQLTFENPCLTDEERIIGENNISEKDYSSKLDFVFVGRLEDEKGVQRILNTFARITSSRIGTIHFIGDGPKRKDYEKFVADNQIHNVVFHGFLTRNEVNKVLESSHIFLLPSSASEGFPKVIAEAANYGVIPIASDVSSIGQYIKENQTGFIDENADEEILFSKIQKALSLSEPEFKTLAQSCHKMAENFTYSHYNSRILNEIVNRE